MLGNMKLDLFTCPYLVFGRVNVIYNRCRGYYFPSLDTYSLQQTPIYQTSTSHSEQSNYGYNIILLDENADFF